MTNYEQEIENLNRALIRDSCKETLTDLIQSARIKVQNAQWVWKQYGFALWELF